MASLPQNTVSSGKTFSFVDASANTDSTNNHNNNNMEYGGDGGELPPSLYDIYASDEAPLLKARQLATASRQHIQYQFATVKPWGDFFDRSAFGAPQGTTDVVHRLNRNISHYYSNYIILVLLCSSYVLLINLAFSICLIFAAGSYMIIRARAAALAVDESWDGNVTIFRWSCRPMQLYLVLIIFSAVAFYATSGSSVLFWLAVTSIGVTAAHAAMRRPPVEENSAFSLV